VASGSFRIAFDNGFIKPNIILCRVCNAIADATTSVANERDEKNVPHVDWASFSFCIISSALFD
jgi:hypothetical protein